MATFGMPAAVARPVNRKEMEKEPEALKQRDIEWERLRRKKVWDDLLQVVKLLGLTPRAAVGG